MVQLVFFELHIFSYRQKDISYTFSYYRQKDIMLQSFICYSQYEVMHLDNQKGIFLNCLFLCLKSHLFLLCKMELIIMICYLFILGWGTILSNWSRTWSRSWSQHWTMFLPWKCSCRSSVSILRLLLSQHHSIYADVHQTGVGAHLKFPIHYLFLMCLPYQVLCLDMHVVVAMSWELQRLF